MSDLPAGFTPDADPGLPAGFVSDEAPVARPEEPGRLEALGRGIKQGATAGFGDELTGALESILYGKDYTKGRDEARAADKAAKEAHGGYFAAGEIGGGAASALVPVGGLGLGAGVAANIARGAGAGIAAGIGNSEADLTKGDVAGVAKDAAIGGLVGGAVGGISSALGEKVLGGAAKRVEERDLAGLKDGLQYSSRIKTFGKSTAQDLEGQWTKNIKTELQAAPEIKAAIRKEPPRALQMVDQKLGHLTDRLEAIYEKAGAASDKGVPLGAVTGRADEGSAALKGLAKVQQEWGSTVANEEQAKLVQGVIDKLEARSAQGSLESAPGHISLQDLRAEYRAWQDIANRANRAFSNPTPREEVAEDIANSLRETLQQHVGKIAEQNPGLGISRKLLEDTNKEVSTWIRIQGALQQKATRQNLGAPPMGDVIRAVHAASHPIKTAGSIAASTAGRALDPSIAKLMAAANAGDKTAAMVVRALQGGVPRGLSEASAAGVTPEAEGP